MSFHRIRDPGALSISPTAKDECELVHISRKRLLIVRDHIGRRLRLGKAMLPAVVTISLGSEIKM
jgi:hypothetical protein